MDAKEIAYAVAGPVAEVAARPPKRLTRQGVYLAAGGASWEYCHGKADMPFQYQRIILNLKRRARPKGYCTRDIRGSKEVLPAGIHKVQSAGFNKGGAFYRRDIMRQGRAFSIGRYCLKAVPAVAGNLSPQPAQFTGGLPLRYAAGMQL